MPITLPSLTQRLSDNVRYERAVVLFIDSIPHPQVQLTQGMVENDM